MAEASFVQTRSSQINKKAASQFKIVKYESHKPKDKKVEDADTLAEKRRSLLGRTGSKQEMNLKRIKHEVTKFGMSGFDAPRKLEAKVALAISLGAKPPRNKYKNYKVLMEERKQEKTEEQQRQTLVALAKSATSKTSARPTKKITAKQGDVGSLLKVYGKVSKKEINKKK